MPTDRIDPNNFVTIVQLNGGNFKLYDPFQVGDSIVGRAGGRQIEIKLDNISAVVDNRASQS